MREDFTEVRLSIYFFKKSESLKTPKFIQHTAYDSIKRLVIKSVYFPDSSRSSADKKEQQMNRVFEELMVFK